MTEGRFLAQGGLRTHEDKYGGSVIDSGARNLKVRFARAPARRAENFTVGDARQVGQKAGDEVDRGLARGPAANRRKQRAARVRRG
jgi:hypothetical protein